MRRSFTLFWIMLLIAGLGGSLLAQGLSTNDRKDDWEEINFVFDSAILSDGYPSLLRLADLLTQNRDYKVRLVGHTDHYGSNAYNEKLAQRRAETVRDFLVKYGAQASQIVIEALGKRSPKVPGQSDEGRFINRRVSMSVTDSQGNVIGAGSVGDVIKTLQEIAKKQQDCCEDILKKLDKLDQILAMLRDLKNENDALKRDLANLKTAHEGVKQQVAELPKAPQREEIAKVIETETKKVIEESKPKRFSLMAFNAGPDSTGNLSFTGKGRFFSPFNQVTAVQAEGEYLRYQDRQEGQFDFGLVNRFRNTQVGLFSSFKRVDLREFQSGGTLGQAAMAVDYLIPRGRIGMFGTKAFLDNPVVNRVGLSRNIFEETYLRVVDQIGGSTQIGIHKDAYIEGNLGALFRHGGSNRPGGTVRFVQPFSQNWAFTVEGGLNETLVGPDNSGRVVVGLQYGSWARPKEFVGMKQPVPMEIPRLRYEVLTRRVRTGNDPPVVDAGPDQIGVSAGMITLDGSNSYDPDGDAITFEWLQIGGPSVSLSGMNTAKATFTAADAQVYSFRLTVKDDKGAEARGRVTVSTAAAPPPKVVRFTANPSTVRAGQTTTIVWEVLDAQEVTISGLGKVDAKAGTSTVAPTQTTMYTLTAKNQKGEISETITVTVERPDVRIISFLATPANIDAGEASVLSWQTENATEVSISGIGTVQPNGTSTVTPTVSTTYTLTAKNQYGQVSATASVVVAPGPRIIRFHATPTEILPTEQSTLIWEVEGASEVSISGIGKVDLKGSSPVSPTETTTYTLTAKNAQGEVMANAIVTVIHPVKILDFVANPAKLGGPGAKTTLTWQTENAIEAIITGVGPVPVNGSIEVTPASDVSYTLLVYGRRSQATALVIVKAVGLNRPPVADAGPDQTTVAESVQLDGSKSYDPDGDPISFSWRSVGEKQGQFTNGSTPIPIVKFLNGWGDYTFELTVTDAHGATSTDTVRVRALNDP